MKNIACLSVSGNLRHDCTDFYEILTGTGMFGNITVIVLKKSREKASISM